MTTEKLNRLATVTSWERANFRFLKQTTAHYLIWDPQCLGSNFVSSEFEKVVVTCSVLKKPRHKYSSCHYSQQRAWISCRSIILKRNWWHREVTVKSTTNSVVKRKIKRGEWKLWLKQLSMQLHNHLQNLRNR